MGDQGRWFKLWVTADDDPDLGDLGPLGFGRWCLFGIYLKKHGQSGRIMLRPPCTALQKKFEVASFDDVVAIVRSFPNCTVTPVTNSPVTYDVAWVNWQKYQGDYSGERVRGWRQRQADVKLQGNANVTPKEEKRREEKRQPPLSPTSGGFETFWSAYPRKVGKAVARQVWERLAKGPEFVGRVLDAIARQRQSDQWTREGSRFIPHPATWLRQCRWEDEIEPETPDGYFTR